MSSQYNEPPTVNIVGYKFYRHSMDKLMEERILPKLLNKEKNFIVTANPEIVMYAKNNKGFSSIIQNADVIVPDGIGVVLSSKLLKTPVEERIAGYDLFLRLLKEANHYKKKVFFLGATQENVSKVVSKVKNEYPNVDITGYRSGYNLPSDESMVELINDLQPDIVFVALGYPKQEEWIHHNLPQFNQGLFVGLGGSFDVYSENLKRAPVLFQKLYLEWLFRLAQEPTRWKRMLSIPQFMAMVFKEKKKIK
ncbi:glycosyltransferase [Jeotgalibacillus sp. S-D1]|uniref:WecB/TagA/CpsF family glycosyltransferase n=1 Tax=Jeotgalibacillus sp. S-D1 TaxID=2552189 RepID=UPI001059CD0B|nr:WecB/TagA/CpsF family glycosyltransferase [Jeotgalibacillus sp. S-D1]TDL32614.1 glycosyltransferase [Jeotgalibacillus sp. S-D1]